MKTTILIHENENWTYYPNNSNKIEHVSRITAGECFFFDPVNNSATSVIPQPATEEDPRAGHLNFSLKFDSDELDWFLDKPSRIKGLKEWLRSISKEDAKRYALEISALPKKEIEKKTLEFDAKAASLSQAEEIITLQMMTSIIQNDNPDIFVIAKNQRDNLIITILKSLPKPLRKIEISMPWSSGMDLGRINTTYEDELPMISRPMYVVTESSQKLISNFPKQFAEAKKLLYRMDLSKPIPGNKTETQHKKPAVQTQSKKENRPIKTTAPEKSDITFGKQQSRKINHINIIMFCGYVILVIINYIGYLKYFANSADLYIFGFFSVMTGVLLSSLILYFMDKNK